MAKQYSCELCEKVFTQSSDLKKHQKKKSPCISINKIQELHQTKVAETDCKTKLSVSITKEATSSPLIIKVAAFLINLI